MNWNSGVNQCDKLSRSPKHTCPAVGNVAVTAEKALFSDVLSSTRC